MPWYRTHIALTATLALALSFCGGEVRNDHNGDGGSGAEGGSGAAGPSSTGVGGDGFQYASRRLFIGDTEPNGTPSTSAWRKFGRNIDGLVSTKDSIDLCKPVGNAPPSNVYPDGDNGIDNAFGKLIMPLLSGLFGSPTELLDSSLQQGRGALLLWVDDIGQAQQLSGFPVYAYHAAPLGQPPSWTLTDPWLTSAESVSTPGDLSSATIQWPASELTEQELTTTPPTQLTLILSYDAFFPDLSLALPIRQAMIEARLAPDRSTATGSISGVILIDDLIEAFRPVVGTLDPNLCFGATFEGLAEQLRQAADILADGSQDPVKTCEAISIGIGFEAVQAAIDGTAPPGPPPPTPCP